MMIKTAIPIFGLLTSLGFIENESLDYFKKSPEEVMVSPNVEVVPYSWEDEMIQNVMKFEGFYAKPYVCPGGKKTIGYGHTGKYTELSHISREKARNILLEELRECRRKVLANVNVELSDNQLCALTSFTFNCGVGNLRKLVNGVNRLNSGNYESVSKILPLYRRANGKILKGLVKRRKWEKSLWEKEELFVIVKN